MISVTNSLTPSADDEGLQQYEYKSLPKDKYIRYLILDPGKDDEPLSGCLIIEHIDKVPDFDAISYVWGPHNFVSQITCDGKIIHPTASLGDALRRVRLPNTARNVWADQVCIYSYRTATKCCRNLRFRPQFCEGFGFASHCLDSNPQKPVRAPFESRLQSPTAPPNTFQLSLLPGNFEKLRILLSAR
jgi:hypothetical protein